MIEFQHVSKRYRLGSGRTGLRAAVAGLPSTLLRGRRRPADEAETLWALRDVSFRVDAGEALGIVGRNGAGKTTILKLLSKITEPTSGRLAVNGRVAALIELGAGFHPDLTGVENAYLYGAILGLSRRDMDRKLNDIVDFAELHGFMDTPVKRYSSGMYARLAFSVAAHVAPDVLLVDEVLSVGDNRFQQKCFDFMHSYVRQGHTTVFISHSLYIEQLCDRLVWLDKGQVMDSGEPGPVLERYLRFLDQGAAQDTEQTELAQEPAMPTSSLSIRGVQLSDASGAPRRMFAPGEDLLVSVEYDARQPISRPHFLVWISDTMSSDRPLFAANMLLDGGAPAEVSGHGTIRCVFKGLPLMPRTYHVWVEAYGPDGRSQLCIWQRLGSFEIVDPASVGLGGRPQGAARFSRAHAPFRVPYEWLPVAAAVAVRSPEGEPPIRVLADSTR